MLPLVPPVVVFLAKHPMVKDYDLSSVKRVGSGAAPLAKDVEDELMKKVNITEVRQCDAVISRIFSFITLVVFGEHT